MGSSGRVQSFLNAGLRHVARQFAYWFMLLGDPPDPPFRRGADFSGEWPSLSGLALLVAVMCAILLGIAPKGALLESGTAASAFQAQLVWILVGGALAAVLHALIFARLFGLRIGINQSFFTFLLLGLPWAPLLTLVWLVGKIVAASPFSVLIIFCFYVLPLLALWRIARGMSLVSGCRPWRAWTSLLLPLTS